ncbi:hypothetical protein [Hymenobacter sp. GOD-10R]|uniref:hypothetical protein n=1 Tax=Hymenobacter sp. GOD-10R TaxID=3093922 RepID=UPI002D772885|nr:hypothetical protein [Hymenobacter sp. GOD-10R]WRQ26661.1 hypothetical protein SD425_16435 [Hymenobacter sp. GOD-10R]
MWQDYTPPYTTEKQYYDIELWNGRVLEGMWPINDGAFYRHNTASIAAKLIKRIRLSKQA